MSLMTGTGAPEVMKVSSVARISKTTKETITAFFERPLFYIYYTALFGMVLSLLAGRKLTIEFYLIMLALTIFNTYAWAHKKLPKKLYGRRRTQPNSRNAAS